MEGIAVFPEHSGQAWVFAGGEFFPGDMPSQEVGEGDLFVCVDRGLHHCLATGFQPAVLIGDMDSVSSELLVDPRVKNVQQHVYPQKKAASDLEIALDLLTAHSLSRVIVLGISGGRSDHMLFNWHLPLLKQWPFQLQFIDSTTRAHVLRDANSIRLQVRIGQTVSLLPLVECRGVTTEGLQYPLENATLSTGSTLGLSNVVDAESAQVKVDSGTLLVMLNTSIDLAIGHDSDSRHTK